MTIERRLHHAARELREVSIDVPPLGDAPPRGPARSTTRRSRLGVLAAPMLFVAGGLLAVGVMQRQMPGPTQSDIPAAQSIVDDDPIAGDRGTADVGAPSVRDELQLIAGILSESPRPTEPVTEVADPGITPPDGTGPS